ncbi:MAG: TlpA family protein disulfide reductase [Sphingobacteriales bacterium]|nr:MAG: TlpA family protein disulfide reductase [Sphingobacteriales bacterium]
MARRLFITAILIHSLLYAGFAQKLQTGIWRGALTTSSAKQIPFNFEVADSAGKQHIIIINAAERLKVTDIVAKGDSVFIHMPLYGNEFRLKKTAAGLSGKWIKLTSKGYRSMDFVATSNTSWRFFKSETQSSYNLSDRWSALFGDAAEIDTAIGEFKQLGTKITGTFLTTTGDHRFLEGTISGDSLYLSCFDGGNAYLFTAKIKDAQTLTGGKFYSEYSSVTNWSAYKNADAKLPDAYSFSKLKPGYKKLEFAFADINGKKVSISDEQFKNKVVIIQVLGSWCPNCIDETEYIVNYYKKYQPKGVEVIGLAYERTSDITRSTKAVQALKERMNIPYPLLITGFTPAKAAQSLPALTQVVAFPTTIIIDKKGDVRKIHTGFNGPATGEHYTEFISEFEKLTDDLLAE